MTFWYRWIYAGVLVCALARSFGMGQFTPFWTLTIALGACAAVFGASPSLVLTIGLCRVLAAVEAYARLTLSRPWAPGSHLLVVSWLFAAAVTLEMRFFLGPAEWDILAVRRYLSVWDGLWMLFALLFFARWGGDSARAGDKVAPGNSQDWTHPLFVFSLVWVEAAGSLAKLARIDDLGFWGWDRGLYLTASGLLLGWSFSVPRRLKASRSCPSVVLESASESLFERESGRGRTHLRSRL